MELHRLYLSAQTSTDTGAIMAWLVMRKDGKVRRHTDCVERNWRVRVTDSLFRKVKHWRNSYTPSDAGYALIFAHGKLGGELINAEGFSQFDPLVRGFINALSLDDTHEIERLLRRNGVLGIETKPKSDFPWRHDATALIRWVTDFELAGRPSIARLNLQWLRFAHLVPDSDCMCAAKGCNELAAYEYQGDNPHMSPVVCLYHYSLKIDTANFKPSDWEELGWWDEVRGRSV